MKAEQKYKSKYDAYLRYIKEKGVVSYKEYCTCGGFAVLYPWNVEHPHLHWCAQYEEYEMLYKEFERSLK